MPWEPLPSAHSPDPRPLSSALDRLTTGFGAPTTKGLHTLADRWTDIVGEMAAAHCEPGRITDGVLVVTTKDPAWTTQLRFLEAKIVAQAADILGENIVKKLDVKITR